MRCRGWSTAMVLPLAVLLAGEAAGQGKGKGKAQGDERKAAAQGQQTADRPKPEQGRGTGQASVSRGQGRGGDVARSRAADRVVGSDVGRAMAAEHGRGRGRFVRLLAVDEVKPSVRRFVISRRLPELVAGGAVAHAFVRGVPDNALVVTPGDRVVFVRNRKGDVLLDLDDDRARTLGVWRVVALDDDVREGSPSFCRSGAGHPVWGRQWCVDKGFGLGSAANVRWGRAVDRDIVVFRESPEQTLTREVLRRVLGDAAFNRLAVHAITLGLVDPLTGIWMGEATGGGPRVLLVRSGDAPVAEIVDVNRDNRAEALFVALRPW